MAAQAEALADFEEAVPAHLDSNPLLALVAADTVVFENYRDPQLCLAWLTAALRAWLRANQRFNQMGQRSLLYRYVILPYPSILGNWSKRSLLVEAILLHLHLQLWHGAICCVIFVDPRRRSVADVTTTLNFLAIPAHGLFYDIPSFYRSDNLHSTKLGGSPADQRLKGTRDYVKALGAHHWLYYDERNFAGPRLGGTQWETLRAFFRNLYGPTLRCSGCGNSVGSFALDHVAPVSKRYFQTIINFRPLCKSCNSAKKDLEGEDPYHPRILIPKELGSTDLDDIYRREPPWLGSIQRPASQRDLFTPDLGLR